MLRRHPGMSPPRPSRRISTCAFGGGDDAIGRYLAQYYPESPEKQLLLGGHFKLELLDYDWTLNSRYLARLKG